MSSNRITVKPSPGITPEQARDARARAWAYVLACFEHHQVKEGGPITARDDAERRSDEIRAKTILP
jgi:hypothetical protein